MNTDYSYYLVLLKGSTLQEKTRCEPLDTIIQSVSALPLINPWKQWMSNILMTNCTQFIMLKYSDQ